MAQEDVVYRLIKGMSPVEKAHFKKFAFHEKAKKNEQYFKLFDYYDKAKKYDSEEMNFKTIRLGFKQPAAAKHQLYRLLLQTLVQYNKANIEEYDVFQRLLEAKLLKQRGFTEESLKELDAAEKLNEKASVTEIFPYIYIRKNYYSPYDPNYVSYKHSALEKAQDKLNVLQDVVAYEQVSVNNIPLVINIGTVCKTEEEREQLEEVLRSDLFTNNEPKSKFGKIMKQHLICFYSYLLNDMEKAYVAATKAISYYGTSYKDEDQGSLQNLSIFHYNAIQYALSTRNEKIYYHHLDEIKKIKEFISTTSYNARISGELLFLNLNWLIENGEKERAYKAAQEMAKLGKELFEYNQSVFTEVNMKIALAFFNHKQYDEAIGHIASIWQEANINSLPEEKTLLSLIEIFSHLKMQNLEISKSRTRSLYRNLSKQNRLFQFERLIVKFINDLYNTPNNKDDYRILLEKYQHELQLLKQSKTESFFLNIIDLEAWMTEELRLA